MLFYYKANVHSSHSKHRKSTQPTPSPPPGIPKSDDNREPEQVFPIGFHASFEHDLEIGYWFFLCWESWSINVWMILGSREVSSFWIGYWGLNEATVDVVTDTGEQLICNIAFRELMVITVILYPMDQKCINVYVLTSSN
ncbi:hypothetical protein FQA39_LY08755 [Lamprigera yunnana]|nr:hypothetical protein FQA39_LY08755 [Lamprigera yunnana]